MRIVIFLVTFWQCCGTAFSQQDTVKLPLVVENLRDSKCLSSILKMEGYLFKSDLNKPNTSEFLYYGLDPKAVEDEFPYLIEKKGEDKLIRYQMLIPILVEALEESQELLQQEENDRRKLEEDFENYKILIQNQLVQMNYQIERLTSEIDGLNQSQTIGQ